MTDFKPEAQVATDEQDETDGEASLALRDAQWAEQAGLPDRAVLGYRKVTSLCPTHFEAHNNLASLLLDLGRPDEALEAAQRALVMKPGDALANAHVGRACLQLGRTAEAIPFITRALSLKPGLHPLRRQFAEALLELGRKDEAIAAWSAVEEQFETDVPALKMMGRLYHRADAPALAERVYLRLLALPLALAPEQEATCNDLAQLYVDQAQYSKAREIALKALHLNPNQPTLWNTLGLAQASLGLVKDALVSYRKVIELAPNLATSHSNLLLSMHYSSDVGPEEMAEEHRRWGRLHTPPALASRTFLNTPEPGRRLRIGYLSPDFRQHSVAFFFESLLDHRNRDDFEVFCYGEVRSPDQVTQRIRDKADGYRSIPDLHDTRVVELIRADAIDILIDLAGHAGASRIRLLGYKPAPVQVSYCGYPDTTGIEAVDYRITDWLADPAGVEDLYTETLCRLPAGFLCFRPPELLVDTGAPPSASGRPLTFGSFNRVFKCSRESYDMWARILRALPESRLIMKSASGGDPGARRLQLAEFESRGIAPDRIELVGFIAEQASHLAGYRNVDIALDTFPYHGTTTTFDSLLMGVPVITLAGNTHASRAGVSLLTLAGQEDLIASTPDEYVALAVELAGQPRRLAELHRTLRERLLRSPLCDGPGFVRGFEYALRGMWCHWCRDQGALLTPEQTAMAAFDFKQLPGASS